MSENQHNLSSVEEDSSASIPLSYEATSRIDAALNDNLRLQSAEEDKTDEDDEEEE